MAAGATNGQTAAPEGAGGPDSRRWLILAVIALAQLMIVLDATVMNIALPTAQRDLHFSVVDRQWVVTAYALAFGSLLLLGGKLADLLGRKVTFVTGLIGFAVASAVGGASVNFAMLVTARACQGLFGAFLAPSALSLLTVTFSDQRERGKALTVYSAVAGAGGAIGLLLGGLLTEYLSWRWCLYANLIFAGIAVAGALGLLRRQPSGVSPKLDLPGAALVSGGMFCMVYGFSNAALHGWHSTSCWAFLAVGGGALTAFGWWHPARWSGWWAGCRPQRRPVRRDPRHTIRPAQAGLIGYARLTVHPPWATLSLALLIGEVSPCQAFERGAQQISLGHPAAEALADGDRQVPRQ
jgi:MFS family permease